MKQMDLVLEFLIFNFTKTASIRFQVRSGFNINIDSIVVKLIQITIGIFALVTNSL